jgi:hypothetical protein
MKIRHFHCYFPGTVRFHLSATLPKEGSRALMGEVQSLRAINGVIEINLHPKT